MEWKNVKPFLLPLALLLVLGAFVVKLNSETNARENAEREAERLRLLADGLAAAQQVTQNKLNEAIKENDFLRGVVEGAKKRAPKGTKVSGVQTGKTDAGDAGGTPREPDPDPTDATPACLVAVGDHLEIRVANAQLKTPKGNVVFTGVAGCYRLTPTETELYKKEVKYEAQILAEAPPPGWGVGASLYAGKFGWAAGPTLAFPRATLLGAEVESTAGVGVGPGGEWMGALTGFIRF